VPYKQLPGSFARNAYSMPGLCCFGNLTFKRQIVRRNRVSSTTHANFVAFLWSSNRWQLQGLLQISHVKRLLSRLKRCHCVTILAVCPLGRNSLIQKQASIDKEPLI
jgi:hypothetical protein